MNQPLRNEAVEHNTREAFRCLRQWQILRTICVIAAVALAVVLAVAFSL